LTSLDRDGDAVDARDLTFSYDHSKELSARCKVAAQDAVGTQMHTPKCPVPEVSTAREKAACWLSYRSTGSAVAGTKLMILTGSVSHCHRTPVRDMSDVNHVPDAATPR
jgi:hypothetical protein